MSSDVHLLIAKPLDRAVVVDRWIGGNGVRDRAFKVLRRPPDLKEDGLRSWSVSPAEALAISEAHYGDGATPDDVAALAAAFPADCHWWSILDCY